MLCTLNDIMRGEPMHLRTLPDIIPALYKCVQGGFVVGTICVLIKGTVRLSMELSSAALVSMPQVSEQALLTCEIERSESSSTVTLQHRALRFCLSLPWFWFVHASETKRYGKLISRRDPCLSKVARFSSASKRSAENESKNTRRVAELRRSTADQDGAAASLTCCCKNK